MAYIDPNKVVSPKANWTLIKVLRYGATPDQGDGDASLAIGRWDNMEGKGPEGVFAMRWNGNKSEQTGVGNPQSRGLPTWFIVPEWMNDTIRNSGLIAEGDMPLVAVVLDQPKSPK